MTNSCDRETRLTSLRLKLGRELSEDLRKEGPSLKKWFIRDFEREILLAEASRHGGIRSRLYTTGHWLK
jgi:hypothetical protein